MKITKRQLKRIIREEKQKLAESFEMQAAADVVSETQSLFVRISLDMKNVQLEKVYGEDAMIEFPISEIEDLIDALYSVHEASRQRNAQ